MSNGEVSGVLRSEAQASAVLADLDAAGFEASDVSVFFPSKAKPRSPLGAAIEAHGGAGLFSPEGAMLGGALGLLAGIFAITIAGVGPFIVLGPAIATVGSTAIGAFAGALVGIGIPWRAGSSPRPAWDASLLLSVYTDSPSAAVAVRKIFEQHAAAEVAVEPAAPDR